MCFCFKKLPLSIKQKFEFLYNYIGGKRLSSVVVGTETFLVNKPLDFHYTTFSVSRSLSKV